MNILKIINNEDFSKNYQIHVIYNTYDIFEHNPRVRELLAENWGMKLRGYKKYFPYGVLPIDCYDYLCHHIIITNKLTNKVVMGIKSLTYSNCLNCGFNFPVQSHLFTGNEDIYSKHILAINEWLQSDTDAAYSSGFTIEPSLSREEKKYLTDVVFWLFYHFYTTYKIPNILQAISKRFKLDGRQKDIGFEMLSYQGEVLSHIVTKEYDNVESDIMVLNNYNFKKDHIDKAMSIKMLWDNREEFIGVKGSVLDKVG
jgi:hypothetical protein